MYRLTWLPSAEYPSPSNEWKSITADHLKAYHLMKKKKAAQKKAKKTIKPNVEGDGVIIPFAVGAGS